MRSGLILIPHDLLSHIFNVILFYIPAVIIQICLCSNIKHLHILRPRHQCMSLISPIHQDRGERMTVISVKWEAALYAKSDDRYYHIVWGE